MIGHRSRLYSCIVSYQLLFVEISLLHTGNFYFPANTSPDSNAITKTQDYFIFFFFLKSSLCD